MTKNGYKVLVARNGKEALEIVDNYVPDIVLLDIMMPDVNGYEICRHIRSQESLAQTKVIFLSAKSNEADISAGLAVGASLYITKPFSTRDLVKQVKQLIAST